jgi:8-amino-7-oxononanoate synthase
LTALSLSHVREARHDDEARARLARVAGALERELEPLRDQLPVRRVGPIFPVLLGTPDRALHAAAALGELGFRAQAIRPPTVARDACRLRVTVNATLTDATVATLGAALRRVCTS